MVEVKSYLYIFVDDKAYILNDTDEGTDYFQKISINNHPKTSGFSGVYEESEGTLWVSSQKSILVYRIGENHTFSLVTEIQNFTSEDISGVIM